MRAAAILAGGSLFGVALMSGTVTAVAATPRPSIGIISPAPGTVVHGSTLILQVRVSNFRLVRPVRVNPPILKGNAGHIHYVIDGRPTFAPSAATSYVWRSVTPGRHTLTAYLATNQYAAFPGVRSVSVTVTLAAPPTPRPIPRATHSPGIGHAPTTGGAVDAAGSPLNVSLLLAGILSLILGLLFLTSRLGAFFGGHRGSASDDRSKSTVPAANSQNEQRTESVTEADIPLQPGPPFSSTIGETSDEGTSSMPSTGPGETTSPVDATEETLPMNDDALDAPPVPLDTPVAGSPPDSAVESSADMQSTLPSQSEVTNGDGYEIRTQAVAMAEQWSTVVDGLIDQLNQQDEERRHLLSRIQEMEQAMEADRVMREQLRNASRDAVVGEELQKLRYVTSSLIEDPDHIVVLAAVAQHAGPLKRIVEDYARIRAMIEGR